MESAAHRREYRHPRQLAQRARQRDEEAYHCAHDRERDGARCRVGQRVEKLRADEDMESWKGC